MALVGWRPLDELMRVHDEVSRLFRSFLQRTEEGTWYPDMDIAETEDAFYVRAELPGMSKDDVKITLQDSVLTISGEKKCQTTDGETLLRTERYYGPFQRSFTLPSSVQVDAITATLENGVLTVKLPKAEEAKPKSVPIEVE
ncbi:MAG TPA: Hsp20/alpha crystallin family protein [Candidatus Latescibacteria bacterium]|nr:Hsp20/alpha crystallin family protein [Candidatus Latescibacterota bacterium]